MNSDRLAAAAAHRHCATTKPGRTLRESLRGHRSPGPASTFDRREQHRLRIEALLPEMAEDTVVSHQSAAVLYGTTLWRAPLERVCVTRNRRGGGRTRPSTRVHGSPVDSVVDIGGLPVTTPARTIVDLALSLPFDAAVVAGDALAGAFGLGDAELSAEIARAKWRTGIDQAREVIAVLDGRSRGIGESLCRIMIHRAGLPLPESQGTVLAADGRAVARVGFYYESAGVICEFDGPTRYGRLLSPGRDMATTLHRERARESLLRALGFEVVRWTWDDLVRDGASGALRAALARQARLPDGRIEPAPTPPVQQVHVRTLHSDRTGEVAGAGLAGAGSDG
ncbi:hypothetical protein [Nocardia sp. NBC_00511]|uniref:hypothetical protein n=1 Tax=Nocardia sp. NBC_00511 TaxID=2903591 RepID=UPI0030DFB1C7